MLVLTRAEGESVLIGSEIRVSIHRAHNGQVHIGIDAPLDIRVTRPLGTETGRGPATPTKPAPEFDFE